MVDGELVRLRAYEPEDLERVFALYNDPDVRRHLSARYPTSRQDERAFLERATSLGYDGCEFAVAALDDGSLIGGAGLRTQGPENRCAELGIALYDKTRWGKGYGTDTMRTLCRFGFAELDLARIELWVEDGNDRARRLYAKVGFVLEGTARGRVYKRGARVDMHLYGLLRGELR